MSVYCIYLGDDVYYGSTKQSILGRQNRHNYRLREGISKTRLYEKARELGITELQCVVLYEGDNYKEVEDELIQSGDCLNMISASYSRERALRLHREAQARYILRKKGGLLR